MATLDYQSPGYTGLVIYTLDENEQKTYLRNKITTIVLYLRPYQGGMVCPATIELKDEWGERFGPFSPRRWSDGEHGKKYSRTLPNRPVPRAFEKVVDALIDKHVDPYVW